MLIEDRIAFCVISTNDSYIYKAMTVLLSIKEKYHGNKKFEYFICGDISERYRKIIKRYNLDVLKLNMENYFGKSKKGAKPRVNFWIAGIPELLYKEGFGYCFLFDGDIFCLNKPPIEITNEIKGFGIMPNLSKIKNLKMHMPVLNRDEVIKKFELEQKDFEKRGVNSGVIIFNNKNMVKNKFKEKFINCYEELSKDLEFTQDETVFALLCMKDFFDIYYFREEFNYLLGKNLTNDEIIFLHLQYKPWKYSIFWPSENRNNYGSQEEYQRRRIEYRNLYINFCKKVYKNKFYLYYFEDIFPIWYLVRYALKVFQYTIKHLRKTAIFRGC